MTQPQPIQRTPSLPAFLSTSHKTQPRQQAPARGLIGSIFILQITSGITLGLVLGQLLITVGMLLAPPVLPSPAPQPTPSRVL